MKSLRFILALLCASVACAQTSIQKTNGTNVLTTLSNPIVVGSGQTVTVASGGTLTGAAGSTVGLNSPTLTTPVITGLPTGSGVAATATASTLVARDANANSSANNFLPGYATTATAAGTTTLTVASAYYQAFTGSTTQTAVLPVTSTLTLGHRFEINNLSSGTVTVNSSGSNLVATLLAGERALFRCILTSGTTAASWDAALGGVVASVAGTTNQISVSTSNGVATVSIPTNPTLPGNVTATGNVTVGTAGMIVNGTTGSQGITAVGTNQSLSISATGTGQIVTSPVTILGAGVSNTTAYAGGGTYGGVFHMATDKNVWFGYNSPNTRITFANDIFSAYSQGQIDGSLLGINTGSGAAVQIGGNTTFTGTKTAIFGATANATIGVSADTTAGVLTLNAPSAGSFAFGSGAVALAGNLIFTDNLYDIGASAANRPRTGYFGTSVVTPAATISGLTSGRVPFASTGGLLADSSALTFNSGTGALSATSFSGAGNLSTLAVSGTITSTKDGQILNRSGASSGIQYVSLSNTGGGFYLGVNNSAGNGFGITGESPYSTLFGSFNTNTPVQIAVNGAVVGTFSSTGISVYGTIKSFGYARVTGDVTNATATMSNLTNLSISVASGAKYIGTVQMFANDSTNTDGLAFDLGGGSATFTDLEFGFAAQPAGSTLGTVTSTSATTAVTLTVVSTSDAVYTLSFGFTCNTGGTFIPRFSQVSHTTGTATVRKNSGINLVESTN